MAIKKLFYDSKCIMTVDMDLVKEDSIHECLNEIFGMLQEKAYEEFGVEKRYEVEARKIWKGYENIYELMNQVEHQIKQESVIESIEDGLEELNKLYNIMQEKLNAEEFEIFKKLRNEEVRYWNDSDTNFFTGEGCLDYVWVEHNGKKQCMF